MVTRILTIEQIRDIYDRYLVFDFPADERKPLRMIEKAVGEGRYSCVGAFDEDGNFLGYAFFVFDGKKYLLDYYAVVPDMRGKGIGTAFLKAAVQDTDASIMLIEVEDPDVCDREARQKRVNFYLNAGCIDTGVRAECFGVRFLLLEYPGAHGKETVAQAYKDIYRLILPPEMYAKNIRVDLT